MPPDTHDVSVRLDHEASDQTASDTREHTASLTATVRAYWLDITLGLGGTALGWMSLWFPFGRDQGLYFYVAREWVMRGAVPYRDVFDHKTPGLYMVHALSVLLFGENMWGIRVLELLAVPLTGLVAATFTVARGQPVHPGVRGVAILTAGVLFFGQLNWWDLSQSEVWYSLLGISSVWAVRRIVSTPRAELAAGALAAAAVIMKPPALWFVLVAMAVLIVRARAARARRLRAVLLGLVRFGAGGLMVALPVFGYFAAEGALADMFEIVIHTNAYYAAHETEIRTLGALMARTVGFIHVFPYVNPLFAGGLVVATIVALIRRDAALRERHLVALALAIAGVAATAMQRKFYLLHWTSLLGPATVIGALLAADCRDLIPPLRGRPLAPLLFALALVGCWGVSDSSAQWLHAGNHVRAYLRGDITREAYADYFRFPEIGFWYGDSERVGRWIKEHSAPDDLIAVRGFEPQIYAAAERRYPGRFFWTIYLTSPTRAEPERRARFREEERVLFMYTPPRYVVALAGAGNDLDNPGWFVPLGYEPRQTMGPFVILERTRRVEREGTP